MAIIARATINWTGFIGAPGYTNLYFGLDGTASWTQAQADAIKLLVDGFASNIATALPPTVTTQIDQTLELIDDVNGDLAGFFTMTPGNPHPGTAAGAYSAASGACISWSTDGIVNARRVRGRTFLVPVGGATLASDGTLDPTKLAALQNAANVLAASDASTVQLVIWSRPVHKELSPELRIDRDGTSWPVKTGLVRDKVAMLRSRRD
jgi:hypothetical protein